jgi:putative ABC transport system substrate-binding protein
LHKGVFSGGTMQRREFITLIGGAAAAWPRTSKAQSTLPVIGFLNGASPDGYMPMVAAFDQGLKEAGYVDGQNVTIEYRWADGQYDQLSAWAADFVRRPVSVIAATGTAASLVAKAATSTIPVVFTTGGDPVQLGLIASLNRPGGNVTGVTGLTGEVAPKRVELAHELVPDAALVGLLVNPRNPNVETLKRNSQAAAATLGLQLVTVQASTETEVDEAFTTFSRKRVSAVVIGPDAFFNSHAELLAMTALRHSVPAIYEFRQFVAAGGLISYGGNIADAYRLAGAYIGRILKGDKPADLPVQQSTKVELIVNLKTAKALGVAVPLSLLVRADEVIE